MPYLTPNEIPEDDDCRPLSIPASTDWVAIVNGALTELTFKWNWEQFGAVTVDEAVARMQTMINEYYEGCSPCKLPGGGRIIRIGAGGHIEELPVGGGDWVASTGDYAYPPVPTRTGGTPEDQICLAAANAEDVLHQIYENLADSFNDGLNEAEALTALVAFIITVIGAEAAPITFALSALFLSAFSLLYSALSYLTDDLWDDNFTKAFTCVLVGCASNDDGVVTFDWDCVEHALYAAATSFGIDEVQLRLYAQINFILWTIGGDDALNTAGATTGITDASCDECAGCGYEDDMVTGLGAKTTLTPPAPMVALGFDRVGGAWDAATGGQPGVISTIDQYGDPTADVYVDLGVDCLISAINFQSLNGAGASVRIVNEAGALVYYSGSLGAGAGWQAHVLIPAVTGRYFWFFEVGTTAGIGALEIS